MTLKSELTVKDYDRLNKSAEDRNHWTGNIYLLHKRRHEEEEQEEQEQEQEEVLLLT